MGISAQQVPVKFQHFVRKAKSASAQAAAELERLHIEYEIRRDGSIFVPGSIQLNDLGLARLPDLSAVTVGGHFSCAGNRLTSLAGAPRAVQGDFDCSNNLLITLDGAPQKVGGAFVCDRNRLATLKGAPEAVGWGFRCADNRLTSLQGAPKRVGNIFHCRKNPLHPGCLKDAPLSFHSFVSDFGHFTMPEEMRACFTRWQQQHEADAVMIGDATGLSQPLHLRAPAVLRHRDSQ